MRQRPRSAIVMIVLLALVAAGVLSATFWHLFRSRDEVVISAERARRLATVRAGAILPGTPILSDLPARLAARGLSLGDAVFLRVFKREFELEMWMRREGRYRLLATYPICRWSGWLGPKLKEGDRQSPEGFYTIDRRALNPNSRWHRSFDLGFPNVHDRAHGRTGSFLMVHGGCSSVGCYAMTDAVIDEIWRLVTAALRKGQRTIHVHAFPFRMNEANIAARGQHRWATFWRDLKAGYDAFEATRVPPRVMVCKGRYDVRQQTLESGAGHNIVNACAPPPVLQQSNLRADFSTPRVH